MAIRIPIISEFNPKGVAAAKAEFASLQGTGSKAMFMLQKAVLPAAAAIGTFTSVISPAIKAASDFQEATSKVNVVFGRASKSVKDFADSAARNLGQSKNAVLEAAGTFGTFGKAAGLAGEDLAGFTTDFVTLSTDLASFNNTSPEEAVMAIGAALRGESEPLRRYGVLLNDAVLKQEAMTLGIYDGKGALTSQQKVLAAQAAIYKQTGDAQGDFMRTSDGLANSTRTLKAVMDDAKVAIGQAFLEQAETATKNILFLSKALEAIPTPTGQANAKLNETIGFLKAMQNPLTSTWYWLTKTREAFEGTSGATGAYNNDLRRSAQQTMRMADEAGIFNKALRDTEKATGGAKKEIESYAEALKDGLGDALDDAKDALDDAKTSFNDFSTSVSDGIKSSFSFADGINKTKDALAKTKDALRDAQKEFDSFSTSVGKSLTTSLNFAEAINPDKNKDGGFLGGLRKQVEGISDYTKKVDSLLKMGLSQDALKEVLAAGQTAGTSIADELIAGGSAAIAETNLLVESTNSAAAKVGIQAASQWYQTGIDSATSMVEGFVDGLNNQVNDVVEYSRKIQELLNMGLSKDALMKVLESGFEAGTAIADELIAGGQTAIDQTNALVDAANLAAEKVGLNAATKWYQTGIDTAQKMVDGIQKQLDLMTPKLMAKMDAIAAKMKRTVDIDVRVTETVNRIVATIAGGGIPKMAEGGIVSRPTLALIGEAGPEAVVPLSKMGSGGGDVNINVTGGLSTSAEIGQSVVNALRAYSRSAGPLALNIA